MAYLISAAGIAVECRLVHAFEDKIEIYAPDISDLGHSLNGELKLALAETISLKGPGEPTRLAGTGSGPDQYILHLAAPHDFWDAAVAAQSDNRRRAFRVRTGDFGAAKTRSALKLISRIEQGEFQLTGTPLDLSLGGCSLQFPGHRGQHLPEPHSQVVLVLEAPFLGEPLRLPAQVVRHFTHTRSPRISLRFETGSNAEWLRKEYRLQDYLMERQREQIRFRAA